MKKYALKLKNGIEASCLEAGSSEETILMIHGNSLGKETFDAQLNSPLSDRYRLIAVDFPGHGDTLYSSAQEPGHTIAGLVDFIKETVTALDLKKVLLVGHSLGGHIAIHAAPDIQGLKGVFAIGTPPLTPKESSLSPFLEHPSLAFAFTAELSDETAEQLAQVYWNQQKPVPPLIKKSIQKAKPEFRSEIGADVAQGNVEDETEIISKLPFPVALAVGEFDLLINRKYMEAVLDMGKVFKNSIQVISGTGHTPHMEEPEIFNRLIGEYASEMFI